MNILHVHANTSDVVNSLKDRYQYKVAGAKFIWKPRHLFGKTGVNIQTLHVYDLPKIQVIYFKYHIKARSHQRDVAGALLEREKFFPI